MSFKWACTVFEESGLIGRVPYWDKFLLLSTIEPVARNFTDWATQTFFCNCKYFRLIHTYHAVPCSWRFKLCLSHLNNTVWPCLFHTYHAALRPCRFASDFSRPRRSTTGARHGMCKLTSAVSRRPIGHLPRFGFFRLPRGASLLAVRIFPATHGILRRTRYCWRTACVN